MGHGALIRPRPNLFLSSSRFRTAARSAWRKAGSGRALSLGTRIFTKACVVIWQTQEDGMESGSGCGGGGGRGGGGAPVPAAVGQPGPASCVSARGSTGGLGPGGVIRAARALDGVFLSYTVSVVESRVSSAHPRRVPRSASHERRDEVPPQCVPHPPTTRGVDATRRAAGWRRGHPPGAFIPSCLRSSPRGRGCRR